MSSATRRLRSLLIALVVLALSAGAVLAGRGSLPPLAAPAAPAAQGEQGDDGEEADAPEPEAPDADDDDGAEADEPLPADDQTSEHPDNHGKLVSEAATAETPEGFDNHGAYVRTVAMNNHGHDAAAAAKTKTHGNSSR